MRENELVTSLSAGGVQRVSSLKLPLLVPLLTAVFQTDLLSKIVNMTVALLF